MYNLQQQFCANNNFHACFDGKLPDIMAGKSRGTHAEI